jgi:hypothetical protein
MDKFQDLANNPKYADVVDQDRAKVGLGKLMDALENDKEEVDGRPIDEKISMFPVDYYVPPNENKILRKEMQPWMRNVNRDGTLKINDDSTYTTTKQNDIDQVKQFIGNSYLDNHYLRTQVAKVNKDGSPIIDASGQIVVDYDKLEAVKEAKYKDWIKLDKEPHLQPQTWETAKSNTVQMTATKDFGKETLTNVIPLTPVPVKQKSLSPKGIKDENGYPVSEDAIMNTQALGFKDGKLVMNLAISGDVKKKDDKPLFSVSIEGKKQEMTIDDIKASPEMFQLAQSKQGKGYNAVNEPTIERDENGKFYAVYPLETGFWSSKKNYPPTTLKIPLTTPVIDPKAIRHASVVVDKYNRSIVSKDDLKKHIEGMPPNMTVKQWMDQNIGKGEDQSQQPAQTTQSKVGNLYGGQ